MPITHVGSTVGTTAITLPAGVAEGDVLVLIAQAAGVTPPTGYTLIAKENTAGARHYAAYKVATASEAAPSFSDTPSVCALSAYRGVKQSAPIAVAEPDHGEVGLSNGTVTTMATLTVPTDNCMLLWTLTSFMDGTASTPIGMTVRAAATASADTGYIWDRPVSAGATPAETTTASISDGTTGNASWFEALVLAPAEEPARLVMML